MPWRQLHPLIQPFVSNLSTGRVETVSQVTKGEKYSARIKNSYLCKKVRNGVIQQNCFSPVV